MPPSTRESAPVFCVGGKKEDWFRGWYSVIAVPLGSRARGQARVNLSALPASAKAEFATQFAFLDGHKKLVTSNVLHMVAQ